MEKSKKHRKDAIEFAIQTAFWDFTIVNYTLYLCYSIPKLYVQRPGMQYDGRRKEGKVCVRSSRRKEGLPLL
jgi:hypothetical protein